MACPVKQLHGILTNIKQKQFNFQSNSDLTHMKKHTYYSQVTSLHKGDEVESIIKLPVLFTKYLSIDQTKLLLL